MNECGKSFWLSLVAVGAMALATNFGLGVASGMWVPMRSDALYFLDAAEHVAAGDGYVLTETFWSGQPSARRMPAWPLVVATVMKVLPGVSHDLLMRCAALIVNAAAAVCLFGLAWLLTRRWLAALVAGLLYAVHPAGLFCAYEGLSEPLFVLLVAAGIMLLMRSAQGGWVGLCAGALVLGCAALVRANFILWAGFMLLVLAVRIVRGARAPGKRGPAMVAVALLLFSLPPTLWTVRNAKVTGHWPVMSTLRGQTFYGGNNRVVVEDRKYWGYWIFPDSVPGETPMRQLAASGMSEFDVDTYYFDRGVEFLKRHWRAVPRMLAGKLVRAYVPIPWNPGLKTWAVALFRWLLYALAAAGIWFHWRQPPVMYRLCFLAMFLTNLATVLIFYGYSRFAFAFEPFLLPFVGMCVADIGSRVLNRR